jgi:hypothetical protein
MSEQKPREFEPPDRSTSDEYRDLYEAYNAAVAERDRLKEAAERLADALEDYWGKDTNHPVLVQYRKDYPK